MKIDIENNNTNNDSWHVTICRIKFYDYNNKKLRERKRKLKCSDNLTMV